MCSSKKFFAVLMKTLCYSKANYLVANGSKKLNSSKNDRFRYEMIVETQTEMRFLKVV